MKEAPAAANGSGLQRERSSEMNCIDNPPAGATAPHPLGPLAYLATFAQFIPVLLAPKNDGSGKVDKLPLDHRTGSVTEKGSDGAHNPAIWMTYDAAAACIATMGGAPTFALGFVLTAADDLWCIDLDNVRTPTGWSDLATTLCRQLPGAVVEVSQSGRGLHLWGRRSAMPPHASKNTALSLECYSDRRFIALGSNAVGAMADDCAALDAVVTGYFPKRAELAAPHDTDGPCPDWSGPTDDAELIDLACRSRSPAAVFGGGVTFADLWERNVDVLAKCVFQRSWTPVSV